jgi:hypothetical protein
VPLTMILGTDVRCAHRGWKAACRKCAFVYVLVLVWRFLGRYS